MGKIKVGEKALAHLSRGLYRSPASALRELISNAWDANAHRVEINLNYPHFYQITVSDNGDGFSKTEFKRLMEGGIGNSLKRPIERKLVNRRPTVGRLGIGMLGIAQICGSFRLVSNTASGESFQVNVKLYDLLRERLDKADPELIKTSEVDVGEYDFEDVSYPVSGTGTKIIVTDVHPTFTRSFQASLKFEKFVQPPAKWDELLKEIENVHSLHELGDYWRLIWELSAACPIPYFDAKSLPANLVAEKQKELVSYDFTVLVDGIQLRKPVNLSGNAGGYTALSIPAESKMVFGAKLEFDGYLCVQEGSQLHPDELRGVLVRIAQVGIGSYDPSFLDYRFNEGPRSRWLTGEIFVRSGLEAALNVDRDSFNKFHPEYRYIQEYLHKILHEEVFPQSYRKIKVRSLAKENERTEKRNRALESVVKNFAQKETAVSYSAANKNTSPRAKISEGKNKIQIDLPDPDTIGTKKSQRALASAIIGIFEIANHKSSPDARRETFEKLLLQLLRNW